jgi:hypothetical protein
LTSSLRGLVRYLEQTVTNPQQLTVMSALSHCSDPNHQDLEKYTPAIERLTKVWGKNTFAAYPGSGLKHVDIGRMCFRGDGRKPETMFVEGFKKRNLGTKVQYRHFQFEHASLNSPIPQAGDVTPETAVCVTPDMNAAALFPLPVDSQVVFSTTWIYLVYVKSGYHTHGRMVLDALTGLNEIQNREYKFRKKAAELVNGLLYGQEMATDDIPGSSVWGALEIWRIWNERTLTTDLTGKFNRVLKSFPMLSSGADFTAGGVYTIRKWTVNENAIYPPGYREAVRSFVQRIQIDVDNATKLPLPTPISGYKPSLGSDGINQLNL